MFSWLPLHIEAASRLLDFETTQSELIAMLSDMEQRGLNVVPLTDRPTEGSQAALAEIDPFTFFAVFNRSLTAQNRVKNWTYLKEKWSLQSPLPRDFDGIPILHPQNAWFFPFLYRRSPDDIPALWELARTVIEHKWAAVSSQLFERCLAIHTIGVGKLTTGLFWLAPTECLPLAATTVQYLKAKNVWVEVTDKASLDTVLNGVRSLLSADFVQESHNAWRYCETEGDIPFEVDDATKAKLWDAFLDRYPDFTDFAHSGEAFPLQETNYKRKGLQKFAELGGREQMKRLLLSGDARAAFEVVMKSVGALNIASFQSWRPSIGSDRPQVLADVLSAFIDATEVPYEGFDTLLPVFNALARHRLDAAWDTISLLLWGLRPSDYFPVKIKYYRPLAVRIGWKLEPGRPTPTSYHQIMRFGRAFWDIASVKQPADWVDVQSFMWGLCQSSEQGADTASYDTAVVSEPVPPAPATLTMPARAKSIWQIAPGENARLWDEFHREGLIAIDWNSLGNLKEYPSQAAIESALQARDNSDGRRSNDARCCWEFANVIAPGDIVVAKQGRYKLLGVGRVTSEYLHLPDRAEYRHVRKVQWLRREVVEVEAPMTIKTLTNITPYPDFSTGILEAFGQRALIQELYGTNVDGAPTGSSERVVVPTTETEDFDREAALRRLFMPEQQFDGILEQLRRKKNVILQGPPGVGKTFVAQTLAYALMGKIDSARVQMVQFHQSYGYEEFIQGLRPTTTGTFIPRKGIFLSFCERAAEDNRRPWVFVIDEINRGNLSKILGELLMLIEADKREERYAMPLAYDDPGTPKFFVPPNVYIIGLMNTADRSLAMVDYALRRRFAFVSLRPEIGSAKFKSHLVENKVPLALAEVIIGCVQRLNAKIREDTADLGDGFCIGHSYLCPPKEMSDPKAWLESVLEYDIKPLLVEYWIENSKRHELAEIEIAEIRKQLA
jgi:hypothetical protein